MRTWYENEDILQQFRNWVTQTDDEIRALPTDEVAEPELAASISGAPRSEAKPIGLLQLVEAFTALRHEVKLQTKSARALEESLQMALERLDSAARQMQAVQPRESEAAQQAAKPLVELLIGLDESLVRGASAVEAAHRHLIEQARGQLQDRFDQQLQQLPPWRRWLAQKWHRLVHRRCAQQLAESNARIFDALIEGYRMIQTRLERALAQHEIRRIVCLGQRVDPSLMTVVELVDDPDAAPETVVEEVRPGYLWQGKVIRFTEVRAVRGARLPPADP